MMLKCPVPAPPVPVFQSDVMIDVKYMVVRGNGEVKLFDTLHDTVNASPWQLIGSFWYDRDRTLLVPLDLLTAHRLGLVSFEDMMLPEAAQAFVHLCQPR